MSDDQEKLKSSALTKMILYISGVIFIGMGLYSLLKPELLDTFLGVEEQIAQIVSGALIMAGITDIIIARIIFRGK